MKYIIGLLILLFLGSCYCKILKFDNEEKFWTDVYKIGDKLVLQSLENKDSRDTISIIDKEILIPVGDCNPMVSNYDSETCVIHYIYKHNGRESEPDYLIQHVKENKGASLPVLRVYGTEFSGKVLKDTTILTQKFGKLKNCFTFSRMGSYNGWSEFEIKTFVWNKEHGLVLIQGINGEKFELIEKIGE